jgi:hypothetical protein
MSHKPVLDRQCYVYGEVVKIHLGDNPAHMYGEIEVKTAAGTVKVDVVVGALPNVKSTKQLKALLGKTVEIHGFAHIILAEALLIESNN